MFKINPFVKMNDFNCYSSAIFLRVLSEYAEKNELRLASKFISYYSKN